MKEEDLFDLGKINEVLEKLKERKFFVSEAHFQTEFIVQASLLYPGFRFFPEISAPKIPSDFKESFGSRAARFDLLVVKDHIQTLIEFKYITKHYEEEIEGFHLELKSQDAWDVRRYDCWKDIARIEAFVKDPQTDINAGYFILITNVDLLWRESTKQTQDEAFRIHEGQHRANTLSWGPTASAGTKAGREKELVIRNDYAFHYEPFYEGIGKGAGTFQSLVIEIKD